MATQGGSRFAPLPWAIFLLPLWGARCWSARASTVKTTAMAPLGTQRTCFKNLLDYAHPMAHITEVEKLALNLPDRERAVLAAHLLSSLPSILEDEDEGIAEALRRDADLEANPSSGISLEQLDEQIQRRRN